jgi:hypothetical protein
MEMVRIFQESGEGGKYRQTYIYVNESASQNVCYVERERGRT